MAYISDASIARVPGWFAQPDIDLFRLLLRTSGSEGGDLAELGVYMGRSAVLLGSYCQDDESLTLIDTFEDDAGDLENQRENDEQYCTLTRNQFERNYRDVLGPDSRSPLVIQGLSSEIVHHAALGAHRFVHVDASHLYEHVVTDLESARALMKPDGIVVLDDYRSAHTPGTAAAAWRAVWESGMKPFALTSAKMYATWGDQEAWFEVVARWLSTVSYEREVQYIGGAAIHRLWTQSRGRSKYVPPILLPAVNRLYERMKLSRG